LELFEQSGDAVRIVEGDMRGGVARQQRFGRQSDDLRVGPAF
jgi:hypothetical protein